jgi:Tol biopolymer transport system component
VTQSWVFPLAARQLGKAPDGKREAIVERDDNRVHQIKIHHSEYGTTRQITNLKNMTYDPAWSPVSDQIAFVSTDVGNDEIYVIDASGGDPVRLTFNDWEWDKHPSWSPDGSQIVFYSNRGSGRRQLWVMNADGSNVHNISNNEWEDWDPVWTR